jgi:hypothetical protein
LESRHHRFVRRGVFLDGSIQFGSQIFGALEDRNSYARLAASGFRLAAPAPIFPRLETPADT